MAASALARVEQGEEVIVTRRGRPVARITGIDAKRPFEDLERRGLVRGRSRQELLVVALRYREGAWPAGTQGAVVIDHGARKMVEISDEDGRCLDLVSLPQERLRLTWKSPH